MKFVGKLYQGETLIDPYVLGEVQIIRRKPLTHEYDGSGHLEASRALPVGTVDIALNKSKGQFILAFDTPSYAVPEKIFVNLSFIKEPDRTKADFTLDHVVE